MRILDVFGKKKENKKQSVYFDKYRDYDLEALRKEAISLERQVSFSDSRIPNNAEEADAIIEETSSLNKELNYVKRLIEEKR